eukprot:4008094-Amphidinium_carterae.1
MSGLAGALGCQLSSDCDVRWNIRHSSIEVASAYQVCIKGFERESLLQLLGKVNVHLLGHFAYGCMGVDSEQCHALASKGRA